MTGFILNPYRLVVAGGGGAGSAEEFINRYTGSAASSADIPLASGYRIHRLVIKSDWSVNFDEARSVLTTDNFSTTETADYVGSGRIYPSNSGSSQPSIIGAGGHLEWYVGLYVTTHNAGVEMIIMDANTSGRQTYYFLRQGNRNSTQAYPAESVAVWNDTTAVDGIRLYPESGTFNYEVNVWGVPSS